MDEPSLRSMNEKPAFESRLVLTHPHNRTRLPMLPSTRTSHTRVRGRVEVPLPAVCVISLSLCRRLAASSLSLANEKYTVANGEQNAVNALVLGYAIVEFGNRFVGVFFRIEHLAAPENIVDEDDSA